MVENIRRIIILSRIHGVKDGVMMDISWCFEIPIINVVLPLKRAIPLSKCIPCPGRRTLNNINSFFQFFFKIKSSFMLYYSPKSQFDCPSSKEKMMLPLLYFYLYLFVYLICSLKKRWISLSSIFQAFNIMVCFVYVGLLIFLIISVAYGAPYHQSDVCGYEVRGWLLESIANHRRFCLLQSCNLGKADKLNVHIVPHTHDDVGWIRTVEEYFYGC